MKKREKTKGRGWGRLPRRVWAYLSSWWMDHEWEIIIGIGALSVILGYMGFLSEGWSHRESLYRAIILFTCGTGPQNGDPQPIGVSLLLEIGRWGSFFAVFYATVRGLYHVIATRANLWRIRNHVVICGFGEKGRNIAAEFLEKNRNVVAVDVDQQKIEKMDSDADLLSVIGSGADLDTLAQCNAARADILLAVTGEDDINLQIANKMWHHLEHEAPLPGHTLRCFIHIFNPTLMRLCHRHYLFTTPRKGISFRLFSIFENVARIAFERYSPDRFQTRDKWTGKPLHVLIIGCGYVGESLLLQAAKIGHFDRERPLKVTVIDEKGIEIERRILLKYPALRDILDLNIISSNIEQLGESEFTKLHGEHPVQVAFLCLGHPLLNLETAFCLRRYFKSEPPRLVLMLTTRTTGLAMVLAHDKALAGHPWEAPIHTCSLIEEGCGIEQVINEKIDCLAIALHEEYRAQKKSGSETADNPTSLPWEQLSEEYRESNRQAADHLHIKLRAVGREDDWSNEPLSNEEIALLARMEHQRWRAERLLNGWVCGTPRDNARRVHPLLLPWEKLKPENQQYQLSSIARLPDLLEKLKSAIKEEKG